MTNTVADGTTKQHWMPRFQKNLDKTLVAKSISDFYTGSDRVIHNPYGSTPVGSDGTATTTYDVDDFTLTDDTLTVNRRATAAEHIDNIEQLQVRYDLAMERADRQAYTVRDIIDQYVLELPVAFSGVDDIDAGDFAGTPGTPYASSNTVVDDIADTIRTQLMLNNASTEQGLFWVVSPFEAADIASFTKNNGFTSSDYAIKNGFTGENFGGLDIMVSNNLYHTVTLALATNVTAGDTITVAGVTFTARAVPSLPGEFDIGADADATRIIIQNAINGSATGQNSATGYFEVSAANREKLSRLQIVATDNASGNTMAVVANGTLIVSETLTDGTDTWGTVSRHTIAGVKGSIQVAVPADGAEFEKKPVSGKHGREVVTSQIYNATIWENMKPQVLDVVLS